MPLGELAALASALLWALNSVLLRPVTQRVSALQVTWLQYLTAAAFTVLLAALLGRLPLAAAIPPGQAAALALASLIGQGAGDTAYVRGLALLGVARCFPIANAGYILLTVVLAAALLGEPVTVRTVAGAACLSAGIWLALLSWAGQVAAAVGDPAAAQPAAAERQLDAATATAQAATVSRQQGLRFAALAAMCWAVTTTLLKFSLGEVDVLAANVIRVPLVALVLTGANAARRLPLRAYSRRTAAVAIMAGLLGLALSSLLFLYAVQHAGAAKTAVLSSTSPLFAAGMAVLFLGEPVTRRLAAGTALSVIGTWLVA